MLVDLTGDNDDIEMDAIIVQQLNNKEAIHVQLVNNHRRSLNPVLIIDEDDVPPLNRTIKPQLDPASLLLPQKSTKTKDKDINSSTKVPETTTTTKTTNTPNKTTNNTTTIITNNTTNITTNKTTNKSSKTANKTTNITLPIEVINPFNQPKHDLKTPPPPSSHIISDAQKIIAREIVNLIRAPGGGLYRLIKIEIKKIGWKLCRYGNYY
jgi:hypothetical protein